jgi:hypothetical protein
MLIALAIGPAKAAASTRAEYIAQVDPICAAADKDIRKALAGFSRDLKRGDLPKAGRKYARADRRFLRSLNDLAAVPPPPEDASLISAWLDLERRDAALPIARALKRRQVRRAVKLFRVSARIERQIDALIGDYGFNRCN